MTDVPDDDPHLTERLLEEGHRRLEESRRLLEELLGGAGSDED